MYIGLDLALSKTGVAFINDDGSLKSHHVIKTDAKDTESQRIVNIIKRLSYLLGDRSYDCCIIEDTYDRLNYEVYKKLTRLCGAVRFWFHVKYKTEADVILKSGETLVMSGLLSQEIGKSVDGLKWLQDIPILGKLFSSTSFVEDKTELVIFLTPEVFDATSKVNIEAQRYSREGIKSTLEAMDEARQGRFDIVY